MSGFADAMSRFAQPLIDASDGSQEDLERALQLSQLCWNLAILPQESREGFLTKMQQALGMDDEEFEDLERGVVLPMIQRHQEMFPALHHPSRLVPPQGAPVRTSPPPAARPRVVKKFPGTGRNEPCPCGSGRKYKVCCGR
jgi:uncharacterized protein YecA (UPF0149 family)